MENDLVSLMSSITNIKCVHPPLLCLLVISGDTNLFAAAHDSALIVLQCTRAFAACPPTDSRIAALRAAFAAG